MEEPAREQLRLDADHVAAASTTSTATSRSPTSPTCAAGSIPSWRSACCSARSAGRPAADRHRLRDLGAPERRCRRATSCAPAADYVARLEPGVRVGLGYDGGVGTWNAAIEPRDGSPVRPHERGDDLDSGATRPGDDAGHHLRAAVRHAHRRARRQRRAAPARAGRAERRGRSRRSRASASSSPTAGSARSARSGSRLREGLRFDVDLEARLTEGAGFSFSADGALAARMPHRQGAQAQGARSSRCTRSWSTSRSAPTQDHFDIRVEVRPHWSATGRPCHPRDGRRRRLGRLVGRRARRRQGLHRAAAADRGRAAARASRRSAAAASSTSPAGPNDRYAGVLTPARRIGQGAVAVRPATAFGIHELTGIPDRRRPRPLVRARDRHVVPARRAPRLRDLADRHRRHHRHRPARRHRRAARAADLGRGRQHPLRRGSRPQRADAARRPGCAVPGQAGLPRPRADDAARVDRRWTTSTSSGSRSA